MLRIYTTVVEVIGMLGAAMGQIEAHDRDLARQLRRASGSIALNVAEVALGYVGRLDAGCAIASTSSAARW